MELKSCTFLKTFWTEFFLNVYPQHPPPSPPPIVEKILNFFHFVKPSLNCKQFDLAKNLGHMAHPNKLEPCRVSCQGKSPAASDNTSATNSDSHGAAVSHDIVDKRCANDVMIIFFMFAFCGIAEGSSVSKGCCASTVMLREIVKKWLFYGQTDRKCKQRHAVPALFLY